ncbi:hypothetical protein [Brevundimonas nasdae]|uniref:Uncharacterized protein n=1 Tax=Brevundimonas nasdae TaxID=172043 RepID=A0ABX8TJU9_9CAUL|nr:hypothetical protein [Brevundimonas nasdae]QYC11491.1 hypothetical protein KWG56_05810 [Brevundimonas nasdae]QYC14279.1 hypothetical protein KWG63_01145 [Brevundimonas nasdae]
MKLIKPKHIEPQRSPNRVSVRSGRFNLDGDGAHGVWAVVAILTGLFVLIALAPAAVATVIRLIR